LKSNLEYPVTAFTRFHPYILLSHNSRTANKFFLYHVNAARENGRCVNSQSSYYGI